MTTTLTDSDTIVGSRDEQASDRRAPELASEAAWLRKRSAPNPRDASLSNVALAWLDRLPAELRPIALCERFPRIANRLAICWGDAALSAMVLNEFLTDRRGNRQGYPPEVQRELQALRSGSALTPGLARRG